MTISIPKLNTHRISVQLQPLTIGQSIAIAKMPPAKEQAEMTAFLRAAIQTADGVTNPLLWTVQERMLAVAHYLSVTSPDGPDFAVGDGKFSDYLMLEIDHAEDMTDLGEACGDKWKIRPLLGVYADSLERIMGAVKYEKGEALTGRGHWLIGAMAAMLVRVGEVVPSPESHDGEIDDWLMERMRVFLNFPEMDFTDLAVLWAKGRKMTDHLFTIEFTDSGIVALPKEGADGLPPCRFPVDACLSDFAKAVA